MFPRWVGTSAVTPNQDRKRIVGTEWCQVLWNKDGMLTTERCVLFHNSFIVARTTILNDALTRFLFLTATLIAFATFPDTVQETNHLLQILWSVHFRSSMIALSREGRHSLDTCSLEQFKELLPLTIRNHTIFVTMENDDGRVLGIDILCSTETQVLIGFIWKFRPEQYIFWTIFTHCHVLATIHCCQVHRARPVASGIHNAGLIGIFT